MNPPLITIVIVALCWAVLQLYWRAIARRVKPAVKQESRTRQRVTATLVWTAAAFLFPPWGKFPLLGLPLLPVSLSLAWAGALLCVAGLLFAIWARRTIADNWSGNVTVKKDHELVLRGPYAFVRHPIYTGMLSMIVGTAMLDVTVARVIGVVLALIAFGAKLLQEEALMLEQFPDDYPAYRARVKRLIPYVL